MIRAALQSFYHIFHICSHSSLSLLRRLAFDLHQSSFGPQFTEPELFLTKQPHSPFRKAEIRNGRSRDNLADQGSLLVPHVHAIPASRIHVPILIALDPIRHTRIAESKGPPIRQTGTIVHDVVDVDGPRLARVEAEVVAVAGAGVGLNGAGVGDVHALVVWAEAEAIAHLEAVGHEPALVRGGSEAVHLWGKHRGRPEGLFVAVRRICEPDVACSVVNDHIVDRGEIAAVEIRDERF